MMVRKLMDALLILCCFLLQTAVFSQLSLAGVSPNVMVILVTSFGLMRGQKEGCIIGFCSGLLLDIFGGGMLGPYSLLYLYVGFFSGLFHKRFFPDDIRLPLLLIASSDLFCSLAVYFVGFLFRGRFGFFYYLRSLILPEAVYTLLLTVILYFILQRLNQRMEEWERRSAKKFDA